MADGDTLMDFKDGFSVRNKWIADIPLSRISANLKDVSLHLTDFSIPAVVVASAFTHLKGVALEIPTHIIQPTDRNITFSYMVDINWDNFFALYQWSNMMSPLEDITPEDVLNINAEILNKAIKSLPINVFLISEYKIPILKITYNNCWIKGFNELSLSYQEEPEPIKHGFICAYSDFKLEKIKQ